MIDEIKAHFWHYVILVLIIFTGGFVFFLYQDKTLKFQVGSLTALAYICWGIVHHRWEKNLNFKIVVEYVLVGVLTIVLLGGILL